MSDWWDEFLIRCYGRRNLFKTIYGNPNLKRSPSDPIYEEEKEPMTDWRLDFYRFVVMCYARMDRFEADHGNPNFSGRAAPESIREAREECRDLVNYLFETDRRLEMLEQKTAEWEREFREAEE